MQSPPPSSAKPTRGGDSDPSPGFGHESRTRDTTRARRRGNRQLPARAGWTTNSLHTRAASTTGACPGRPSSRRGGSEGRGGSGAPRLHLHQSPDHPGLHRCRTIEHVDERAGRRARPGDRGDDCRSGLGSPAKWAHQPRQSGRQGGGSQGRCRADRDSSSTSSATRPGASFWSTPGSSMPSSRTRITPSCTASSEALLTWTS